MMSSCFLCLHNTDSESFSLNVIGMVMVTQERMVSGPGSQSDYLSSSVLTLSAAFGCEALFLPLKCIHGIYSLQLCDKGTEAMIDGERNLDSEIGILSFSLC